MNVFFQYPKLEEWFPETTHQIWGIPTFGMFGTDTRRRLPYVFCGRRPVWCVKRCSCCGMTASHIGVTVPGAVELLSKEDGSLNTERVVREVETANRRIRQDDREMFLEIKGMLNGRTGHSDMIPGGVEESTGRDVSESASRHFEVGHEHDVDIEGDKHYVNESRKEEGRCIRRMCGGQ
eukprot:553210-Hanusia_phi.AAC.1